MIYDMDVVYIMLGAIGLLMISWLILILGYIKLRPVMPYLWADLRKRDLLFLIDKVNRLKIIPSKYSTGWIEIDDPKFLFLQKIPASYQLGSRRVAFAIDQWGITLVPEMANALQVMKDHGYASMGDIKKALESGELDYTDEIMVDAFRKIDFKTLLEYVSEPTPSSLRAHVDEKIAAVVEQYMERLKATIGSIPIFWVVVLIGIVVVGFLLLTKGNINVPSLG